VLAWPDNRPLRQESTVTSVRDPQLSNQKQVTGAQFSQRLKKSRSLRKGCFRTFGGNRTLYDRQGILRLKAMGFEYTADIEAALKPLLVGSPR
jgi:hypothetical protein